MKTVLEVISLSADFLKRKGFQHPKREAEELLSDVLNLTRMQLYLDFERPLNEQELEICRKRLQRRIQGEPLAYIHGETDFYGCKLNLTSDVLIPRQETEILVDKVAKALSQQNLAQKELWDVCCGSGCIGIALKKKFPELTVVASDLSSKALDIAKQNAKQNGVDIIFLEGDLLVPFQGRQAHYFVCNPPYISEEEFHLLESDIKDHEPYMALVAGESGLEFYERLVLELPCYLHPSAKVWFEIGYHQGTALKDIFSDPHWKNQCIEADWSGKDRFFFLEIE
jgi:release factor glutamine methyltransferase